MQCLLVNDRSPARVSLICKEIETWKQQQFHGPEASVLFSESFLTVKNSGYGEYYQQSGEVLC